MHPQPGELITRANLILRAFQTSSPQTGCLPGSSFEHTREPIQSDHMCHNECTFHIGSHYTARYLPTTWLSYGLWSAERSRTSLRMIIMGILEQSPPSLKAPTVSN